MKRIFGEEARLRRAAKKEERHRIHAELYNPQRLTPEERWALMDIEPSEEAAQTGLPIWPGIVGIAQFPIEMESAAAENSSFVRQIRLLQPLESTENLRNLLEIGNHELNRVAQACGAVVIGHHYGLYDNRVARISVNGQPDLIPEGFILAARVDSIRDTQPISASGKAAIERGIGEYLAQISPYKLRDNHPGQFTYGTIVGEQTPRLYMHDVDLLFA